ncbi:MAG: hypothetical protein SGBAC_003816 [Bacillariaceae sp.]
MVDFARFFQGSLFFASGIVVILAIVGTVYFISWCYDTASGEDLLTPAELEARRVAPVLVRQAGLAGLLKDEQTKAIKYHFEANSFPYVKETRVTKTKNEASSKNTTEASSSKDEKLEKAGEPESAVDKEIVRMEEGEADDTASDDNHKEEETNDQTEASNADEVEESQDGDSDEGKAEYTTAASIEKSEESAGNESPATAGTESDYSEDKTETKEEVGDKDENSYEEKRKELSPENAEKPAAITDELEEAEEGICSICLGDYESGEKVIIGSSCGHIFHFSCFMEWVEKKHMTCPICRSDMITPDEFIASSYQCLGDERVDKIRGINEEAARRMEEWSTKQLEEMRQRQEAAATATGGTPEASTVEQTANADVEEGGDAVAMNTDTQPEAPQAEEEAATAEIDAEAETDVEKGKDEAAEEEKTETRIEGDKAVIAGTATTTTSLDVSA